jgi:molybdate transport system ATP-binding protein
MLKVQVEKSFPGFQLESAFTVNNRELLVILGPSGSGKSLTLHCIAGLVKPDRGSISLNDEEFYDYAAKINLPAHRRRIGYIFQDYALFPHLTVRENIAYGLRGKNRSQREEITVSLIKTMRLQGHENKYPRQISGGQKQRVAIARALAVEPGLLLLDEPFSALDNIIRHKIRTDMIKLREEVQIPMIMVTHDLEEAYTLGERLIVMDQGKILQAGKPQEIFTNPVSRQVAKFVGMRNIFQGKIIGFHREHNTCVFAWKGQHLVINYLDQKTGDNIAVGIRPEEVMLIREDRELGPSVKENIISSTIVRIIPEGLHYRLYLRFSLDNYDLEMLLPRHVFYKKPIKEGDNIKVSLKLNSLKYLQES